MQQAHEILGLPAGATHDQIKSAWRKAVKENHPDVSPDPVAANRALRDINAAKAFLLDGALEPATARPHGHADRANIRPAARRTGFGFRQQREEAEAAERDRQERERQRAAWTREQAEMRQRFEQGKEDMAAVRAESAQAGEGDTPQSRIARALRERRQERNGAGNMPVYEVRRTASDAGTPAHGATPRSTPQHTAGADALKARTVSAFGARDTSEIVTNSSQDSALEGAIDTAKRRAARDKIAGNETPGGFHKAQKVTLDGRTMQIHLGSPASQGVNAIALPEIVQNGSEVRLGKGVRLASFKLARQGGQKLSVKDPSQLVNGADGIQVQIVFSDERVNLRQASQARDREMM